MADDSESEPESHMNMFQEPEGFYPPTPPPKTTTYTLHPPTVPQPTTLTLHLVGHSPTEAHHLWNGSRVISEYLEAHPEHVRGASVLELGAGAGLPSLVAGVLGARRVVVTDYPDPDILETLQRNVDECAVLPQNSGEPVAVVAKGYVWGADARPLLAELRGGGDDGGPSTPGGDRFDVLILADLLFRHSEHGHMLDTVRDTLARPHGRAFVFFTSYRPWLRHKDLAFFDLARARGFVVETLLERKMDRPGMI